jgi:hypothetical protein
MSALLSLIAYDREDLMVAALAGLMVAGLVVAVGGWLLVFRAGRHSRMEPSGSDEPAPVPGGEGTPGEPEPRV